MVHFVSKGCGGLGSPGSSRILVLEDSTGHPPTLYKLLASSPSAVWAVHCLGPSPDAGETQGLGQEVGMVKQLLKDLLLSRASARQSDLFCCQDLLLLNCYCVVMLKARLFRRLFCIYSSEYFSYAC